MFYISIASNLKVVVGAQRDDVQYTVDYPGQWGGEARADTPTTYATHAFFLKHSSRATVILPIASREEESDSIRLLYLGDTSDHMSRKCDRRKQCHEYSVQGIAWISKNLIN